MARHARFEGLARRAVLVPVRPCEMVRVVAGRDERVDDQPAAGDRFVVTRPVRRDAMIARNAIPPVHSIRDLEIRAAIPDQVDDLLLFCRGRLVGQGDLLTTRSDDAGPIAGMGPLLPDEHDALRGEVAQYGDR